MVTDNSSMIIVIRKW